MSKDGEDASSGLGLPLVAFNAFQAVVDHLGTIAPELGTHMVRVGNEPATKRDLFDIIQAQSEVNFRTALALASIASDKPERVPAMLDRLNDGLRQQADVQSRILGRLLVSFVQGPPTETQDGD